MPDFPDEKRFTAALERARPSLLAILESELRSPRVLRDRALELTEIVIDSFKLIEPKLDGELSPERALERRTQAASLQDMAFAFYGADILANPSEVSKAREKRFKELKALVHEDDNILLSWAMPAFRHDAEATRELEKIRAGRGIKDNADDVIASVGFLRSNWSTIEGKTPLTLEVLSECEARASELIHLLTGVIESDDPGSPSQLRIRAYTSWAVTYQELALLGRYLERENLDANSLFPLIYTEPAPKKKEENK